MAVNWTPQQQNAIEARGGSLLVSAAAGSGKTAVLVQRVIGRMLDPHNPVDADRMLIVTFTSAAADEMRQRISKKLWELLEQSPDDKALLRQQLLLEKAKISTIHAFCLDLIREHFQLLDVAPDFRIADERELELLRARAVEDTIASLYMQDGDGAFSQLVELVSSTRDDSRTQQIMLRLYDFIRSHPFYEDWLDAKAALYRVDIPVEESPWGRVLLDFAAQGVDYALLLTRQSLDMMAGDEQLYGAYSPAFLLDLARLEELRAAVTAGVWDGVYDCLSTFGFERLGRLVNYADKPRQDAVKENREQVKKLVGKLRESQFCATAAQHREDMADLWPKVATLFEAVKLLGRNLDALKAEKKLVDFSDLEHLAIRLLVEKTGDGYRPSPAALRIAGGFEEVLVDEFQDTNGAQDFIFKAVSRQEQNLFLVGDVKQSIYRFRQAMPEIFIQKKEQSLPYNGSDFPAKIILGKNFRSRSQLTGAVNFLFNLLMSREMGEINYNEEERLIPGAEYPDDPQAGVELHLIDAEGSAEERTQIEARYVAAQIRRLLESGLTVTAREGQRPIAPGDICVLLRSPKGRMQTYTDALTKAGVPSWADNQSGFLTTDEVSAVVALLQAVDNPLRDLPLVQALLSPLFGFSADRIAAIRLEAPGKPFYLAVTAAAQKGAADCALFLDIIARLRCEAASLPADRIIQRLYDLTGFLPAVQAMEYGSLRLANLRLLVDYAGDYEGRGYRGLCGFVGFINQLLQRGGDLAPASVAAVGAVTVMSIHRSKGLEFPVVVLADTARSFNKRDLRENALLHPTLGFACMRRGAGGLHQFTTLPIEAIKTEGERSMLSEELRVLYVALTRARERMLITACPGDVDKALAGLASPLGSGGGLSPWLVRSGGSYCDWLLAALLHHPDGAPLRERGGAAVAPVQGAQGSFRVVYAQPDPDQHQPEAAAVCLPPADPQLVQEVARRAAYRYPYPEAVATPAKLSVSQVAAGGQGGFSHPRRPAFLAGEGMTGAERGTALHKFMEFADLAAAKADIQAELARLGAASYLSAEEAAAVDLGAVARFLRSPLAGRMFAAQKVYRELRFLCEAGSELLAPYISQNWGDEKTVLQGMADCVFIEQDGAVIIDYKTDKVGSADQLTGLYRPQLELYALVLADYLGVPVRECWLYSFALGEAVRVV